MYVEGIFNSPYELSLGLFCYYGQDEEGDTFHAIELGILIFSVVLYRRIK